MSIYRVECIHLQSLTNRPVNTTNWSPIKQAVSELQMSDAAQRGSFCDCLRKRFNLLSVFSPLALLASYLSVVLTARSLLAVLCSQWPRNRPFDVDTLMGGTKNFAAFLKLCRNAAAIPRGLVLHNAQTYMIRKISKQLQGEQRAVMSGTLALCFWY